MVSSESKASGGGGAQPPAGLGVPEALGTNTRGRLRSEDVASIPGAKGSGGWAGVRAFAAAHPRLVAWLALAAGMVAILLWASRDQPLLLYQRLVLVAATVGLAGLCAWIIHWE